MGMELRAGTFAADWPEIIQYFATTQGRRGTAYSLAVIVFVHEDDELAPKLLKRLPYWHYRSEDALDIVFPGYVGEPSDDESKTVLEAKFSPEAFSEVIGEFERRTTWRYSGHPSVMLLSVKGYSDGRIGFSFSQVIDFDLARALRSGSIESLESFFEALIGECKKHHGEITQHRLSDILGATVLGKSLLEGLLAKLKLEIFAPLIGAVRDFRLKNRNA